MALTRAQLLMGDSTQGPVLTGQVQAVRAGAGISIDTNGNITVDSQTVVGLMKLGQTSATASAAYNGYQWPTTTGSVGQQLTISAISGSVTVLDWDDPDGIPWTAKGQLLVGTGAGSANQTLLNVGANGQILIADSFTTSGLNYTSNYVSTTGSTGAANIPAGSTGARPSTANAGALRYNSTTTSLEFWNGGAWETVASSSTNSFVEKTSDTGAAIIPSGSTGQQPGSPVGGYFRFNDTTDKLEFWNGSSWQTVASSSAGAFVEQTVPTIGSPSAVIPAGTTANRQTNPAPAEGYLRYNTSLGCLEVWTGSAWDNANAGVDTFSAGTTGLTPATATSGTVTLAGTLNISNGGTGATTAPGAINNLLPSQGGNAGRLLVTDGTNVSWSAPTPAVTSFSAGTTGFNPSVATTGAVTLSGFLNVAHGGTGATTQAGAANNILPSQGGQSGRYLTTDGANVSWAALSPSVTSFSAGTTGFTPSVASTGVVTLAGTLNVSNGGTGATTAAAAANNLLPSQAGNAGKALVTDGAGNLSWAASGLAAATLAQAAAGNLNTVANTPETSVPKDAAGMTGAAILPTGIVSQRPSTPVTGMLRFNTGALYDPTGRLEVRSKDNVWRQLAYVESPDPLPPNLTFSSNASINGTYYCNNLTINAGVTLSVNLGITVIFVCTGNVVINGIINADAKVGRVASQFNGGGSVAGQTLFVNYIPGIGYGTDGDTYSSIVTAAGSSPGTGRTVAAPGGSVQSSVGGAGGGGILIRAAGTITMGATAQLLARGGNATAGTIAASSGLDSASGAGGGSGGIIVLRGDLGVTTAGTISVSGGNGANAVSTNPNNATGAGGGGGGGWVILQTAGTLTNGATISLAGGSGGTGVNTGAIALYRGMSGGGYGGVGGSGGITNASLNGSAGGSGNLVFSGSPI